MYAMNTTASMPDLMVAFLGWNSNFGKKSAWGLISNNIHMILYVEVEV